MVAIKKEAKDYTPEERMQIIVEGMNGDSNIKEIADKYNISRDTYYSWKNALLGSAKELWEENHAGRKKKAKEEEDVEALKKKIYDLEKQKELDGLKILVQELMLQEIPEKYKKKPGVKWLTKDVFLKK